MVTIEDAKDLEGYVVYAGEVLPFLWTHLIVYPNKKAAVKAASGKKKMKIVPVKDLFYLESYLPFEQDQLVTRVASLPGIPREERPRR